MEGGRKSQILLPTYLPYPDAEKEPLRDVDASLTDRPPATDPPAV